MPADTLPQEEEDQEEPEQPQDYFGPLSDEDPELPGKVVNLLQSLGKKVSLRETWPRLTEIKKTAEQRYFYSGYQRIYWNANAGCFQVGNSGASITSDQNAAREPRIQNVFNIYLGYGKSFMAVFSQSTPGTRFEADDPKDPMDIQAAQESDKMRQIIEKFNDPKTLQIDVARYLWTDGRVVAFTDFEKDEEAFGLDDEGEPAGQETIELFGALESKIPYTAKNQRGLGYVKLSKEFAVSDMKAKYPDKAKQISSGAKSYTDVDEVARNARIGIAEGTRWLGDDSIAHLCTRDIYFFRTAMFWEFEEDDREMLLEYFPSGCRVTFVGSTYVESRDDSMDDHIAVMQAIPGDGQRRISLGAPMVPVQTEFNDFMDLLSETGKYVVPATWCDEAGVDIDAIQEQAAEPGSHYTTSKGARNPGEPLGNLFYTEQAAQFPEAFMQYMENLQGPLAQFLTGQLPALFGGNMEDQKTARGYAQARDQALGLLALNWLPFKKFYAEIMEQAVRCAANNRDEGSELSVQMEDDDEPLTVKIATLKGNTVCSPVTDENFPESWTQKSNKMMGILQMAQADPVIGAMIVTPENAEFIKNLVGMKELKIKGADSVEKQWKEIAQMKAEPPTPDVQAIAQEVQESQMTGQPLNADPSTMPEKSSIEPDPEVDENDIHYAVCKDWLNSPDGLKAKKENPDWYKNVRLHMLEHKALIQAAAIAAAPPPPVLPAKPLPPQGAQPPAPPAVQ